jgi:hypothetical protein
MPLQKVSVAQRDFSAGEIDVSMKRDEDSEVFKKGLRQCSNFRILTSNKLGQRLGRTAKFIDGPRVDEVLMAPGQIFYLVFGNHALSVYNAAGTRVFHTTLLGDGATTIPWTAASVVAPGCPRWDIYLYSIYIAYDDGFPANVPQILTWDGVSQTSTWTLATYVEEVIGVQKRTPFYRISPTGITMSMSATSGSGVTATTSAPVFVAGMVGTRMRYIGRQFLITGVATSPTNVATVTIEETLFSSIFVHTNSATDIRTVAVIGDVIIGAVSGCKIQITALSNATDFIGQMLNGNFPQIGTGDTLVGPGGSLGTALSFALGAPTAVTDWDDEVMNVFRGYPSSVAVDQGRLILSNIPSVPAGIIWSAIGNLIDLYVPPTGISPDNAIFEITPAKNQVQDVVAGNEGSEFVFCDNAVFGIPINVQNPLSGSSGVTFQKITDDGAANVQPRRMQNIIVYANAGGKSMRAIMTTGAYYRSNESREISEYHNHLINAPVAIACPTANDPNFSERYFYVLNGNGTIAVGKIDVQDGNVRPNSLPGWVPESGVGTVKWVSSRGPNMMFTTSYPSTTSTIAEQRDFTQYLDAGLLYNAVPAPFTPPGGKGPLWWMAGGTCTVLDQGTRQMGLYNIDANGFLIPQNFGGENLASAQLVVGQAWTGTVEPFIPAPGPGQDLKQRMVRIKIARISLFVENSTGWLWTRLFSGPLVPVTSPAYMPLGTVQGTRRVTTYNQDDDPTQPPPLREGAEFWRPAGRSFDPRIAVVKDTSGPLTILEIGAEVTV